MRLLFTGCIAKLTILLGLVDEQAVSDNVINNKKDVWITRKFALATMTTI